MLQVESIAIALLGALLGVAIGVLFGASIQSVMSDDGLGVLDIPVLQLAIAVLVAAAGRRTGCSVAVTSRCEARRTAGDRHRVNRSLGTGHHG